MKTKIYLGVVLICFLICGCTGCSKKNDLGGWKQANTLSNYCTTSEDGYYFIENNILSFFDFESEKAVPLCSKSGCLHKDESCSAKLNQFTSMYYREDKLYTIDDSEDATYYYLTKREKDGTSMETILTVAEDEIKKGYTYQYLAEIWSENYLWVSVSIEDGASTTIDDEYYEFYKHQKIYCYNVESGKEEKVIDIPSGDVHLLSADSNRLVYMKWKYKNSCIPMDDVFAAMFSEDTTIEIYTYDLETDENKKMMEYKGNEVNSILGVVSNKLLICESNGNLTLCNLEDGEKEVLYKEQNVVPVMLTDSQLLYFDRKRGDYRIFDIETQKLIEYNLNKGKEYIDFISFADDKYFIHRYTEMIDEDTYTGEKSAFISQKDLEKGEANYKDLYN